MEAVAATKNTMKWKKTSWVTELLLLYLLLLSSVLLQRYCAEACHESFSSDVLDCRFTLSGLPYSDGE